MDKTFSEIRTSLRSQAPAFIEYIRQFVLDDLSYQVLMDVSSQTDVYVFSGVIRNYLLGEPVSRDIDFVVRDLSSVQISNEIVERYNVTKNSYGGLKISINNLNIDVWDIENTWSLLKNNSLKATPHTLIKTAFFNFSAVVYDVARRSFIFDNEFLKFYKDREIDVVNGRNPNDALCIANTLYYAIITGYPIKYRLCKWIVKHYSSSVNYEDAQLAHFHKVLYNNSQIEAFYKACKDRLQQLKKQQDTIALTIEKK